eukprot:scpid72209/ scgid3782/ 
MRMRRPKPLHLSARSQRHLEMLTRHTTTSSRKQTSQTSFVKTMTTMPREHRLYLVTAEMTTVSVQYANTASSTPTLSGNYMPTAVFEDHLQDQHQYRISLNTPLDYMA